MEGTQNRRLENARWLEKYQLQNSSSGCRDGQNFEEEKVKNFISRLIILNLIGSKISSMWQFWASFIQPS